jgi:hypothetical protein
MEQLEELLAVIDGEYGEGTEEAEETIKTARDLLDEWLDAECVSC